MQRGVKRVRTRLRWGYGGQGAECGVGRLRESAAVLFFNPKGVVSSSPGLRGTSYPGKAPKQFLNPEGVVAWLGTEPQPLRGWEANLISTQGSSFLATLGFEPESRWDSPSMLALMRSGGFR
jgi:hypothetical protein